MDEKNGTAIGWPIVVSSSSELLFPNADRHLRIQFVNASSHDQFSIANPGSDINVVGSLGSDFNRSKFQSMALWIDDPHLSTAIAQYQGRGRQSK